MATNTAQLYGISSSYYMCEPGACFDCGTDCNQGCTTCEVRVCGACYDVHECPSCSICKTGVLKRGLGCDDTTLCNGCCSSLCADEPHDIELTASKIWPYLVAEAKEWHLKRGLDGTVNALRNTGAL